MKKILTYYVVALAVVVGLTSISINAQTDFQNIKIKNFGQMDTNYFRGGQPKKEEYKDLKAIGKAFGMPTTLIVDPNGCELASLAGPAEWASGDAVKLVTAALKK